MTRSSLHSAWLVAATLLAGCGGGPESPGKNSSAPAPVAFAPAAPAPTGLSWRGVSLAGAEFGEGSLPGTHGTHYIYPSVASVAYFKAKGMNASPRRFGSTGWPRSRVPWTS